MEIPSPVHLRPPNVILGRDWRARLVDFDWAGKEGEVFYSTAMNIDIEWPDGAVTCALILRGHDLDMLAKLVDAAMVPWSF